MEMIFNGVDLSTGDYATPPVPLARIAAAITGETPPSPEHQDDLNFRHTKEQDSFSVKEGVNAEKLSSAGWGVIFAKDFNPDILTALRPLLLHRAAEAGSLYREFSQAEGKNRVYQAPESKRDFLRQRGAAESGGADPQRMPYYLLLVGTPEEIPYEFQYQLDVQYAVGRIHFDSPADYGQYARNVLDAETGSLRLPRKLSVFAPSNENDAATLFSTDYLAEPISKSLAAEPGWSVDAFLRGDATKARLTQLMGGTATPALLFTSSHGASNKPFTSPHVARLNGALLCQEWMPRQAAPVPSECYFSGDDIAPGSNLLGTIGMLFCCYGGGSPQFDNFPRVVPGPPRQIAAKPFVANLPRQMLLSGALATIAHIDRALGYSFMSDGVPQIQDFESTLKILMAGKPVGLAMEAFNARYAELASDLAVAKAAKEDGTTNDLFLIGVWSSTNDARNYLVIGDPAARLRLADAVTEPARPAIRLASDPIAEPAEPAAPVEPAAPTPGLTIAHLTAAIDSILSTIEVRTCTSAGATADKANLRAHSTATVSGQLTNYVAENCDPALLQLHSAALAQALQNRTDLLKAAIAALLPTHDGPKGS